MWSPDGSIRRRAVERAGVAAVLAAALVLGGCNVRPLYSTAATGSDTVRTALADVEVVPIEGRPGQQIYNDLNYMLNGGEPGNATYGLTVTVRRQYANLITRGVTGLPGGRSIRLTAIYTLRKKDQPDVVILQGGSTRLASYDFYNQRFANDRAEIDAENRAAREVAEDIRVRLASYFATGRVPTAPVIAETDDGVPREFKDTLFDPDDDNYGVSY